LHDAATANDAEVSGSEAVEGQMVTLFAEVGGGSAPFWFQWSKDAVPIPGATDAVLTLGPLRTADAGAYTVEVSNPYGSIVSPPEMLRVRALPRSQITNVSILAPAQEGIVVGFALGGANASGTTSILARAAGPALAQFGVVGAIADPKLDVSSGSRVLETNDDWSGDSVIATLTASVGGFSFPPASKDSALVLSLGAGNFTARVVDTQGGNGVAAIELYALNTRLPSTTPRLINVSARAITGTGRAPLIAGFTIEGETPARVLLRGVGPGLTQFGIANALARPRLTVFRGSAQIATNANWNSGEVPALTETANAVGAFALPSKSLDAALLLVLLPGSYTAEISSADDASSGLALIEVYEVP
jgi:hypothetical protein